MIGLCFKYDATLFSVVRDQYYELANAFPDLKMFERNVPDDEKDTYCGTPIIKVNNADDLPDCNLVVITPKDAKYIHGEINLLDYKHPENAIYFLGDDHNHLTQEIIGTTTNYDAVYLPVTNAITNRVSYWSSQAATVVLYDRVIKNGQ